jgi:hypothetical protein
MYGHGVKNLRDVHIERSLQFILLSFDGCLYLKKLRLLIYIAVRSMLYLCVGGGWRWVQNILVK